MASGALVRLRYLQDRTGFVTGCVNAAGHRIADELGDVEDIRTHKANQRIAAFGQALARHSADQADTLDLPLTKVARFLHVERRYLEAAEIERRVVSLTIKLRGPEDRLTLQRQSDLAISLARYGRIREARDLLQHCAVTMERCFGPEDIDTLTIKHNLAIELWGVDQEAARKLALDVYRTRLRVLGPDHEHTLFSLHTLLSYHVVPSPYDDAVTAYQDLIARRTRLLGEDHTTTLTSILNYVQRLVRVGDPQAALSWARKVLERRIALYGPENGATFNARSSLLLVLSALPAPPTEEIRALTEDMQHYATAVTETAGLESLSTAGETIRRSGNPELAVAILRVAQRMAVATLDRSNGRALLVEHNLAAALAANGEPATAKAMFDELIPRMQSALGTEHRLTLRARRQQALLLARLGVPADALERQLALAATWQTQAGAASPEYAEALGDIATTYDLMLPTGQQSPLDGQKETVSLYCAMARTSAPVAIAALKIRAPSRCTARPLERAVSDRRCRSCRDQATPPCQLCVFSIMTAADSGW